MLKMTFSTGVLSIPTAYYTLGLINGLVMTIIFGCINTCMSSSDVSQTQSSRL